MASRIQGATRLEFWTCHMAKTNTLSVVPSAVSPEPILLDIPAAARALCTTPWAVRSLLWDRKIPFIKIGRKHLIDPADLRAYIAREKSGGAS